VFYLCAAEPPALEVVERPTIIEPGGSSVFRDLLTIEYFSPSPERASEKEKM